MHRERRRAEISRGSGAKAVDLLDEACSKIRVQLSSQPEARLFFFSSMATLREASGMRPLCWVAGEIRWRSFLLVGPGHVVLILVFRCFQWV